MIKIPVQILFLSLITLWSSQALAQTQDLRAAFLGAYTGRIQELDTSGQPRPNRFRDIDLEISGEQKGLQITLTILFHAGDRGAEGVKRRAQSWRFDPTGIDHLYRYSVQRPWFALDPKADPMSGDEYRWVRLEENAISIYTTSLDRTGKSLVMITRYTLAENGKYLDIQTRRIEDDVETQSLDGRLVRAQ